MVISTKLSNAARLMGRKGGRIGGPAAARKLTPQQRKDRAKKASDASLLARQKHRKETNNENNG